jgi:hypothetical protein
VLTAATGTDIVPDLTDMSEDAAIKAVARSSFRFSVDPADLADEQDGRPTASRARDGGTAGYRGGGDVPVERHPTDEVV